MSWLLLTIIGVFIFSTNNLLHRVLMKDDKSDPFAQTVAFFGLAGTFALIFSFFHGGFHYQINFHQFLLFLPLAICATAGPVLLFKSFQLLDASENAILQSSGKLWMVLGAFILLGEPFSIKKIAGTLIIMFGIAIALWKKKKFRINEGVILVFMATLFYTGMDLISYYLIRDFDAISFIVYISFLPVITLLIVRPQTLKKLVYYLKPKYALCVSILSFNDVFGSLSIFYAYQIGRNVSQISPLMGLITIISVFLGIVFLKEHKNIPQKILGALVVLAGVMLVL